MSCNLTPVTRLERWQPTSMCYMYIRSARCSSSLGTASCRRSPHRQTKSRSHGQIHQEAIASQLKATTESIEWGPHSGIPPFTPHMVHNKKSKSKTLDLCWLDSCQLLT
eukprot:2302349-Amphidinium_carterae.1